MTALGALDLQGVENARDLGGMDTADGGIVMTHELLRSAALGGATPDDVAYLCGACELSCVIDLRTDVERKNDPDPIMPDVNQVQAPLFTVPSLGLGADGGTMDALFRKGLLPQMTTLYRQLVAPETAPRWHAIFDALLSPHEGSVLWHCSHGKDRCGVTTAVVLSALGVPHGQIVLDYLETNEAMHDYAEARRWEVLDQTGNEGLADKVKGYFDARPSYLNAALDAIGSTYGGIEGFLHQVCGVDAARHQQLRDRYLQ